jgi:signal transduction histidine kinase
MTRNLKIISVALCFLLTVNQLKSQTELSEYQFRGTLELIDFVQSAADYFALHGQDAFGDFSEKDSKWWSGSRYLFIYDLQGICIFHPVNKELQGQNLIDMQDMNGKPVIKYIIDIASRKNNPRGWVHYLWAESGEIFPYWKSAYVMRVEGPDSISYAIGSGTYDLRMEKSFMVETVDSAANLIAAEGTEAFSTLIDKSSVFYFSDIYLFVISTDGKAIVDPAFPDMTGRDLMGFQDGTGRYVIRELIEKLGNTDEVFTAYLWPRPGQSRLSKKILYARKVKSGDKLFIVGSGVFQTNPIWHKF